MVELITNVPERVNINHRQTSTHIFQRDFAEDISGRFYVIVVRKNRKSTDMLLELTSRPNGEIVILDGPNGLIEVTIDDSEAPLPAGEWVYDMDVIENSKTTPVMSGQFCVVHNI